jgi:GTP-binding protein HflX
VNEVLRGIGADTIPQILVFNKIDAVPELAARGDAVERDEYGNISRVFLSARTGQGLDALRAAIAEIAASDSSELNAVPEFTEPAESAESPESTQSSSYDEAALPEDHRPASEPNEHDDRKVPEHGH